MKNLISLKQATVIIIVLMSLMLMFHTLVLIAIIPYDIVWAGKINSEVDMKKLEMISIFVNAFAILVLLFKAGYLQNKIPVYLINTIFGF